MGVVGEPMTNRPQNDVGSKLGLHIGSFTSRVQKVLSDGSFQKYWPQYRSQNCRALLRRTPQKWTPNCWKQPDVVPIPKRALLSWRLIPVCLASAWVHPHDDVPCFSQCPKPMRPTSCRGDVVCTVHK